MKKRIYLSGASNAYPKAWKKTIKDWFELYNDNEFKIFDPSEYYNYEEENNHYTDKEIMNYKLRAIKMSNVVLVNIDCLEYSIETNDEILYAYINDIPVIAFSKLIDPDIHPQKREQIDRIETGKDALTKAMTYIASYY